MFLRLSWLIYGMLASAVVAAIWLGSRWWVALLFAAAFGLLPVLAVITAHKSPQRRHRSYY